MEQTEAQKKTEELWSIHSNGDGNIDQVGFSESLMEMARWAVKSMVPEEPKRASGDFASVDLRLRHQAREEIISKAKDLGIAIEE